VKGFITQKNVNVESLPSKSKLVLINIERWSLKAIETSKLVLDFKRCNSKTKWTTLKGGI
jgi:hypothetical protein